MSNLLQSPIIHWAGLAVRIFHVYLRNLGIMAHHIQRAVSQQRLQRENIPSRTQVGDRKGVAEFMRVGMRESCAFAQTPNEDAQAVTSERSGASTDEEGLSGRFHPLGWPNNARGLCGTPCQDK